MFTKARLYNRCTAEKTTDYNLHYVNAQYRLMSLDSVEADMNEDSAPLAQEDIKNRLAAAEFDIKTIGNHVHDGSHPNLMEV
jgi:hypothetical protein